VFDFETDGKDPNTVNPVELAAVPVEPRTLSVLRDETFSVTMKPDGIDNDDYFTKDRMDAIKWHAKCRDVTTDEIIEMWKNGLNPKTAWENFVQYAKQYNIRKTRNQYWVEPIAVGYNILNFDLVIAKRLAATYDTNLPFSTVKKVDLMDLVFTWFENLPEPANLKMDTLRPFFGLPDEGDAHEALNDVLQEATILTRFLGFHRRQATVAKFKGAFNE
jgi:DNA polymerase III epsilon subunit-like protein